MCVCVCVGEHNGARGARGWGSALPGGLSPPRGPARRGHWRAHWPPSGVVCSERETTPRLLLSGLERVGETRRLRLKNGADDLSPSTCRQNESILILLPSPTRDPTSKRRTGGPSASRTPASAHAAAGAAEEAIHRHLHLGGRGAGARRPGGAPHVPGLAISGAPTPSSAGFVGRREPPPTTKPNPASRARRLACFANRPLLVGL